jgi:ABC-type nitrate/sulfonate/bicarbonate transport system substrate-binding protein
MSKSLLYRYGFSALVFALLFVVVGCSGTSTPIAPTASPDVVRVQMAWTHEYSSAYFYTAELNHHFAEQNLQVMLEPGGFVNGSYVEPVDQVVSGEFDFGAGSAAGLLQARTENKPVVAIAAIFQRSPTAIISLADSDIQQPQDLVGKTVAVSEGGAMETLKTMLISQGMDLDQVNIVPREGFGVDPLMNGDVDALVGWIINEGVQVRSAGGEPNFMLFSDYGVLDYSTLIFTTEKTINERPELVTRFMKALIAGLQDVVDNPEQAAEYTVRYNAELDQAGQLSQLQASLPLIQPARAQLGMMQPESWDKIYDVLVESGNLTTEVDYHTAYTMSFLNDIYKP